VSRIFGESKAGHTGTLDPLATGVLPVLIGRAVKASEYMLTSDKFYRAELLLGVKTDTEDVTGSIISNSDNIPDENSVLSVISEFVGKGLQTPPMYSALKIGGKKLYELAREGKTVEREKREITIHSLSADRISENLYSLDVHCSKGTYIRTLCNDIGDRLGCGGTMKELCRTKASIFTLEDSVTVEELEKMSEEERLTYIIPIERIFEDLKRIDLPDFFARLAECGVEIYLKKLGMTADHEGQRVTLWHNGEFFALGEIREFPDGTAIKPIKQFLLK
jgi:tRNA pseudouridine55 synthase